MGRKKLIDDAALLKIARELFLSKGGAASTIELAKRAGVSEAAIFKRFKTKGDLFRAAMKSQALPWMVSLRRRAMETNLETALAEAGVEAVTLYRKILPSAMVSWSNREAFGLSKRATSRQLPPFAREFVDFFEEQMAKGHMRRVDALAFARSFAGAMMSTALFEIIHGRKNTDKALAAMVQSTIDVLWNGAAPRIRRSKK